MATGYLSKLARGQRRLLVAVTLAALVIALFGLSREFVAEEHAAAAFDVDMSIRQIAPQLGVTGKSLAREFDLPLDVPKGKPLKALGVSQEQLDHAAAHIQSHEATSAKYYVFAALSLFGVAYLTWLGRPRGSAISERKTWYPRTPYYAALVAAVVLCGFALGKSPNPMEGAVKVFKSMVGLYPSVATKVLGLVFFLALAIVGNKVICGWACPFGALQELIYSIPVLRKIKRRKPPFWLINTLRAGLFVIAMLLLFGVVGGRKGFVVYHSINPFNLFNFDFDIWTIPAIIVVALVLSFVMYRPFCQLICPFGLLSWFAERVSLTRVRVDHAKCTQCGACVRACPTTATQGLVDGKTFSADCFSCTRCLNVCPEDAIGYGLVLSRRREASQPGQAVRSP